ncbi:unnamed protein product, partial [Choristocarpus tenellus]
QQITSAGKFGLGGVRRVLRMMDESGAGRLDSCKLQQGLREFGGFQVCDPICAPPLSSLQVFKFFDRNGDGAISSREFLKGLQGPMGERRSSIVRAAFDALDVTKDGFIRMDHLKKLYKASRYGPV